MVYPALDTIPALKVVIITVIIIFIIIIIITIINLLQFSLKIVHREKALWLLTPRTKEEITENV